MRQQGRATVVALLVLYTYAANAEPPFEAPTGVVTLGEAVAAALALNPGLEVFAREERVREAREIQAATWPNPDLRTEVENFGGSGGRQAFERTETTLSVAQLLELGGKRRGRRRLAELATELAGWDYAVARSNVLAQVESAFIATVIAQERVRVGHELAQLAGESFEASTALERAGAASPAETMRTDLGRTRAAAEVLRRERLFAESRRALAATWGASGSTVDGVAGDLGAPEVPPPLATLEASLSDSPQMARFVAELAERRAALDLERSRRVPDVTVRFGGRRFSDTGDNAMVAELSLPLPLFDRNRGGILEASERLGKAEVEREAATVTARGALATAHAQLVTAREREARLRTELIPQARAAADASIEAYRKGAVRQIDVLDVQRLLVEAVEQRLDALAEYHAERLEIERLTARPLARVHYEGE